MFILLTSPNAVAPAGPLDPNLAQALKNIGGQNNPVGLISNHAEPSWFASSFGGNTGVSFIEERGRQNGDIVLRAAKAYSLNPHDVLVLAYKNEDVQMGKNGGAVLIAAGWSTSPQVKSLGIYVNSAQELNDIVSLVADWHGHWWYTGSGPRYQVRALADLSRLGSTITQQQRNFARQLTQTVKNGGSQLNALLAITARSLLMEGVGNQKDLVWCVYPSSSSSNNDTEVLSDFTHRLRTTVSRTQFCKRGEPLFIRHSPSIKRSGGGGGDRTDPTGQITTIHLNPFYRDKGRLVGKNVIVVDDCTTYGVSFGVAAAFLRKAGAASVLGIALGKFGDRLEHYAIDIQTDPFAPVGVGDFTFSRSFFTGARSSTAQQNLRDLIS